MAEMLRALVVEDSRHHALVLVMALKPFADVVHVTSVPEALTMLQAAQFDLVVCDWHLGERTGEEVLAVAATLSPKPLCVGYSGDSRSRELALQAGADDFVEKGPYSHTAVVALVQDAGRAG